jgi:hypothetical protein
MSPENADKARAALERAGDDVAKLAQLDTWCATHPAKAA